MCLSPSPLNPWTRAFTLISHESLDICFHPAPSTCVNTWTGAFTGASLAQRQAPLPSGEVYRQLSFPFLLPPQLYEMFSSVMKHLPGPQQQAFKELQGLQDFIAKKVEQNQRTLDPNSPRDFIDSFLIRMQEVHASSQCKEDQSLAEENQARGGGKGQRRLIQMTTPIITFRIPIIIHCSLI